MAKKKADKESGFEDSLERLETIVEEVEGGELSLEAMMGHFDEGQKLVKQCSKTLNEVERKIEILVKKGDQVEAEAFEDEGAEEEEESDLF